MSISNELHDRLSKLFTALVTIPEVKNQKTGERQLYVFDMCDILNPCGTAGCAIGLDICIRPADRGCDVDDMMRYEGFVASRSAIFYANFGEYDDERGVRGMDDITPAMVAARIDRFLTNPQAFEDDRRTKSRKLIEVV